jgi:peptide/nickel transport system permease protein
MRALNEPRAGQGRASPSEPPENAIAEMSTLAAGSRRNRSIVWAKFRRNRLASASAAVVVLLVLLAIFAPWVARHDPLHIDMDYKFAKPGQAGFLLGTDELGRDLFSRLLYAGRVSLAVGLMTALVTIVIGSVLGALAGYYGGAVDTLIMRFADVLLSIPTIFVLLALSAFLKATLATIILIIGLNSWMSVARLVRGQILSIKQQEFILAARTLGASDARLIFGQLLPNALAPVLVAATLNVANAILTESSLSYLGYGIQPPTASWGNMLNNAQSYVLYAPWVAVYPGIMITLTVLGFNFAGDGLRDALDPRLNVY